MGSRENPTLLRYVLAVVLGGAAAAAFAGLVGGDVTHGLGVGVWTALVIAVVAGLDMGRRHRGSVGGRRASGQQL
jgi:hypothetical protein